MDASPERTSLDDNSIFHLRNLKNVEKAAISCVFEVDR